MVPRRVEVREKLSATSLWLSAVSSASIYPSSRPMAVMLALLSPWVVILS